MAGVDKNCNIIDFPDGQLGWNRDNMAFQWCFYYDNWQGNTWALHQIKYQIYFICIYCFRSRKWWASNDAWQHLFQLTDYSFLNLDTEVDLRWPMPQCCSDQYKILTLTLKAYQNPKPVTHSSHFISSPSWVPNGFSHASFVALNPKHWAVLPIECWLTWVANVYKVDRTREKAASSYFHKMTYLDHIIRIFRRALQCVQPFEYNLNVT